MVERVVRSLPMSRTTRITIPTGKSLRKSVTSGPYRAGMDVFSFAGGVLVGVLVTTISDFLRPWVHRLNRRIGRWIDIRGCERDRRRSKRR